MTPYSEKEREEAMRAVEAMMMAHPGSSAIAGYNNAAIALYMQNRRLRDALLANQWGFNHSRCSLCGGFNMGPNGETDYKHTKQCIVGEALAGGDGNGK